MANDEERREPEELGQDPFVERRRPDPSQPPEAVSVLEGLLGDSDREGYKRLYFSRELDYYAQFRTEDLVGEPEPIPEDQPPFMGERATRVGIRRGATIEYTRSSTARADYDEFDLDIRLAAPRRRAAAVAATGTGCTPGMCVTHNYPTQCADTCPHTKCFTCEFCTLFLCPTDNTKCNQATCANTCPDTCAATCGPPWPGTCATCTPTCYTNCWQRTCFGIGCGPTNADTCENTHCYTCREGCTERMCAG